ncbi:right-handed parallel beta-helix repeat-containing protein [Alienimonas chondri]|uniref:Right handed beta helix domain-containing protein n=1 Tax=Alienimonas chondri TaxID=2681879 RepID=A0ABX1VDT2_9PLAN|nr:right-handed parallel beta-helix repeat-containing protein [Alienimonas chondri]NNJ26259.1 hypothetical protein [Alienimonas chondri]
MRTDRRPLRVLLPAAFALLCLGAGTADAATYYVRTSGNDTPADPSSWGNSADKPWRTVRKAAAAVVAGDTVYVGAGTYDAYAPQYADGTAASRITYIADTDGSMTGDAGVVRLRPAATYSGEYGYWLGLGIYGDYTTVRGFTFSRNTPSDTRTSYAAATAYCTEIRFENCRFENCTGGLGALEGSNLVVSNCTFHDCSYAALQGRAANATISGCTFTESSLGVFGEDSTLQINTSGFTNVGPSGTHIRLTGTTATVSECSFNGGGYGVYRSAGAGVTISQCTFADAAVSGAYLTGNQVQILDTSFDRCGTAVSLLDPTNGAAASIDQPVLTGCAIRDSDEGISTTWKELSLTNVVVSGHSVAGILVSASNTSFTLTADDILTCVNNGVGILWPADPTLATQFAYSGQSMAGNGVHIELDAVDTIDVRNVTMAGGDFGLAANNASSATLRDSTFSDIGANVVGGAGADLDASSVSAVNCVFLRDGNGLRIRTGVDPDLRDCTFDRCSDHGLYLSNGSWNWVAADNLAFIDNRIGVYGYQVNWTIDGGAGNVTIDGPGPLAFPDYTFGLLAIECSVDWRNVSTDGAETGMQVERCPGAMLTNCAASAADDWGLFLYNDPADASPTAVTVQGYVALECENGLGYSRNAATAAGAGQLDLSGIDVSKTVVVDSDGYLTGGASGTGIYLERCSLAPSRHGNLTISGFYRGIYVNADDLVVDGVMNLVISKCQHALYLATGVGVAVDATVSNWTDASNWSSTKFYPEGGSVTVTDCDFTCRSEGVAVDGGGSLTAERCTIATRDLDCIVFNSLPDVAATLALTDCDLTAGDEGIDVDQIGNVIGDAAVTRCRIHDAGGDGIQIYGFNALLTDCSVLSCFEDAFDVAFDTTRRGTATFDRCTAAAFGNDGFETQYAAFVARDCTASSPAGDDGFQPEYHTADIARCSVFGCVDAGYNLLDCSTAVVVDCVAYDCLNTGADVRNGCETVRIDNFLAVGGDEGVTVSDAGALVTLNHVTLVTTDEAVRLYNGSVALTNSILVGVNYGIERNAGTATTDHVLIDAPNPYDDVPPGSNDILKKPLFRDVATRDYRLAAGSPAINVGKDLTGVVDADLLGYARPSYGGHDLGAYEYEKPSGGVRILKWKETAK